VVLATAGVTWYAMRPVARTAVLQSPAREVAAAHEPPATSIPAVIPAVMQPNAAPPREPASPPPTGPNPVDELVRTARTRMETAKKSAADAGAASLGSDAFKSGLEFERQGDSAQQRHDSKAVDLYYSAANQFIAAARVLPNAPPVAVSAPIPAKPAAPDVPSAPSPTGTGVPTNVVPTAPAPVVIESPPPIRNQPAPAEDPQVVIRRTLEVYRHAYESMDTALLLAVYPSFGGTTDLQKRFDGARQVAMALSPAVIQLSGDANATATCTYSVTFTSRSGKIESPRPSRAEFQLHKVGQNWLIAGISVK